MEDYNDTIEIIFRVPLRGVVCPLAIAMGNSSKIIKAEMTTPLKRQYVPW